MIAQPAQALVSTVQRLGLNDLAFDAFGKCLDFATLRSGKAMTDGLTCLKQRKTTKNEIHGATTRSTVNHIN